MEQSPSESIILCTATSPCPVALRKGILRRRRPSVDVRPPLSTCSVGPEAHKCVAFAEQIEEHQADDWDRSCCAVARPTFRDILELKQIQRELLPEGRGVVKDQYEEEDNFTFSMDDGDDVEASQRCRRPPPPCSGSLNRSTIRPGAKFLNRVPVALCPILPCSDTSSTSSITSPVQSPPSSPALGPKRSHPKPIKFCPLLPVVAPLVECTTPPPSVATSRVPSPTIVGNNGASSEKVNDVKASPAPSPLSIQKPSTSMGSSTASPTAPPVGPVRDPDSSSSTVTSSPISSPRSTPSSPILISTVKRDIPALSRTPPRRAFDFIPLVPSTSPVHSPPSRRNSGSFCSSSPNAGMMGSPIIMFNSPVQT